MAEPKVNINPDELFSKVMDTVFTPTLDRGNKPITEEALGTKIASVKFNLERDIFDVLANYDIPRDKAIGAVANFIQNLARIK